MSGYVYLIKDLDNSVYKIGVTKKIEGSRRLKALQTGNASELKLLYSFYTQYPFRLETMIHNKFKQYHISGEWYDLPLKYVDEFELICTENDNIIMAMLDNPFFNKDLK